MSLKSQNYYLNQIKNILGIRNRFWRKSFSQLKPHIESLYTYAMLRNYIPFRLALGKLVLKIKQNPSLSRKEMESYYFKKLVLYLNIYKKNKFLLDKDQKARLVQWKGHYTINIIHSDGSEAPIKRKKILQMSQKIFTILDKKRKRFLTLSKQEIDMMFIQIFHTNHSLFANEEFNPILDFIESPIGKVFNEWIPGLSLLLEIQKEREALQEQDFLKVANYFLMERIKSLTKKFLYMLTKQFTSTGKYFNPPLAVITAIAFERYESYKKSEEILNQNFQKLISIYKEIQEEKQKKEQIISSIIDRSPREELQKLLDLQ